MYIYIYIRKICEVFLGVLGATRSPTPNRLRRLPAWISIFERLLPNL